jgi:hypothetical protein
MNGGLLRKPLIDVMKIRKSAYLQPKSWSLTALFLKADF